MILDIGFKLGDLIWVSIEEVHVDPEPLPCRELSLTIGIQLLKSSKRTAQLAFWIGSRTCEEVEDMQFLPGVFCRCEENR